MSDAEHLLSKIEATFKSCAAALKEARVPFVLGGGLACWARGGPETYNDLDLMVKPDDAERALQALVEAGLRPEDPPEDWLLKAWDGDVLVDLIFRPIGMTISEETFEAADELNVFSIRVQVMSPEDVISTKLLALSEHFLDYEPALQIARSLREQIDWATVRARTSDSPYARAFFALLDELGLVSAERERGAGQVRVVPASAAR